MVEFFAALVAVAVAELGDKTQFIALLLAARFPQQRVAILAGMVLAMILMHGIASSLGFFVGDFLMGDWISIIVGVAFIAMGLAMLLPEKHDDAQKSSKFGRFGPFLAAFLLLSLSEIADKSQIVTMMLAAHYGTILPVAAGAVVGMNLVLAPVIFFGAWITQHVPLHVIKIIGCIVFVVLGLGALLA